MSKFNWQIIAKDLLAALGGKKNLKSFQNCATRFRFYVKNNKLVSRAKLNKIDLAKGVNKDGDQWQVIFGAGTVNKVHDAFQLLVGGEELAKTSQTKKQLWDKNLSAASNSFTLLRRGIRSFADIFIPLIPVFIAGGLSLALSSLIGQVSKTQEAAVAKQLFDLIGGGILGSLPAFVGYTAMKKFGGTPMLGLAIGIIMVAPQLLNGWISSSNYVITPFGTSGATIEALKNQYIIDHFHNIYKDWIMDGMPGTLIKYAGDNGLTINHANALLPNAPKFFQFAFIGYQAQVFPTLGIIALAYWIERGLKKISHESFAIILVPLGTVFASIFLGFLIIGPAGRYVGFGITYAFENIYKYTNWPGFGLGGALLGFVYPFLVVTGLHQGFIPVEVSLIAETQSAYGHSFTWITAIASVSNVAQGMVGLTLAVMLWKKAPKASSKAISGAVSANLGITEPILFGVNLPTRYGMFAAATASAIGCYYVGMTHTVANSLGSASWLGLVQFDFSVSSDFHNYINDYGFHTTPGLRNIPPVANEAIALTITTVFSALFTLIFSRTFGKKAHQEFIDANTEKRKVVVKA